MNRLFSCLSSVVLSGHFIYISHMLHGLFCLLLLSIMSLWFLHLVAWISVVFFFISEQYSVVWMYPNLFIHYYLSIHLLMNIWIAFAFELFWIVLPWSFECKSWCGCEYFPEQYVMLSVSYFNEYHKVDYMIL